MKNLTILAMLFFFLFSSCDAQTDQKKGKTDQKNLPKTDIKVNKEYDESGNLIRFDSTYTYYYSNIENNEALNDSIFDAFKNSFNSFYPFSFKPFFEDFFFEDSLLIYDFYKEDFFEQRFLQNMQRMELLFKEIDSMKNDFFGNQFLNKKSKQTKSIEL